jgi:hypothetical protein
MWSLPVFAGTVLGCFLFAFLLSFIPGLRSRTPGRLLLINIISWAILAVGDNAARGTEDLGETLARIGVAQFVVFLLMLGWATAQKKGAAEVKTQEPDEPQRVVGFSVADEIEKLDRLRKSGLITDQEFARLRTKLVS